MATTKSSGLQAQDAIIKIGDSLKHKFVERDEHIDAIIMAVLGQLNILFLGPPGVAKSALVRAWAERIDGAKYFESLVSRFSTPDDLFGPISATGLAEDRYMRKIEGYLPEAHFGFVDEVFKSSAGMLNAMLGIMNERIFVNDGKVQYLPLFTIVGASNEVPDKDDGLDALFDRFHIKMKTVPIHEMSGFQQMLMTNYQEPPDVTVTLEQIKAAQDLVKTVNINEEMIELLTQLRGLFRSKGFTVSDRQWKVSMRALRAAAFIRGADQVQQEDFEFLMHMVWSDPEQERGAMSLLLDKINPDKNEALAILDAAIEEMRTIEAIKDNKEMMSAAMGTAANLKKSREKMTRLINERKKHGKNTADLEKMDLKLSEMLTVCLKERIGIDFNMTK